MGESITELETELSTSEGDQGQATKRFLMMMDELDVEQSTQEHALAILKDEGLPAVRVSLVSLCLVISYGGLGERCFSVFSRFYGGYELVLGTSLGIRSGTFLS